MDTGWIGSDRHRVDEEGIGKVIDTGSIGKHLAQGGSERNWLRADVKVYPYKANGQLHTNTGSLDKCALTKINKNRHGP